jgi:hypothetical protein
MITAQKAAAMLSAENSTANKAKITAIYMEGARDPEVMCRLRRQWQRRRQGGLNSREFNQKKNYGRHFRPN